MDASSGRSQRNLTHSEADDMAPLWSCDGQQIAFQSDRDGNWEVYTMDAFSGRRQKSLTHDEADDMLRPVELPLHRIYLPLIVKGCKP